MSFRTTDQRRAVRERRLRRLRLSLPIKIAVSVFLLWHLFAMAEWNLPYVNPLTTWAMPAARPYMVATGFMQGWGMFAPDPYSLDIYCDARIHYADGTTKMWEFPRMEHMGFWERYQKERWRKYIEIAHSDDYYYLWPPMAKYAAQQNNDNPNNPPVSVDLIRCWRNVRASDQAPAQFNSYKFTTVDIHPEDLK